MISVTDICKDFGGRAAVTDVSFDCVPGTITGLLGPNGAGKSTVLKMLLGLVSPTRGLATIDGVPYRELPNPGRTVGVSLDASGLHPGRTLRGTIRLAASIIGVPTARADEVLAQVGLAPEYGKLVRNCSLGMRQRLSIGLALLGEPRYLILDEPVNGLDPSGMAWIRRLLQQHAEQGHTVLLSSHLLKEVESIADNLVIIDQGRVAARGTLAELIGSEPGVLVSATDAAALRDALDKEGIEHHRQGGDVFARTLAERIGQLALDHGIVVTKLTVASTDRIEQMYFESISRISAVGSEKGV
ncbi:ATP-binding cassette domain-containing protein [Micromonospora taraxaci]|uniref:ABC transporter ATP-binding protein n=1 Tax=Micromonospora taraxaci TaxID=1316803 RepID=UPI0033D42AAB